MVYCDHHNTFFYKKLIYYLNSLDYILMVFLVNGPLDKMHHRYGISWRFNSNILRYPLNKLRKTALQCFIKSWLDKKKLLTVSLKAIHALFFVISLHRSRDLTITKIVEETSWSCILKCNLRSKIESVSLLIVSVW